MSKWTELLDRASGPCPIRSIVLRQDHSEGFFETPGNGNEQPDHDWLREEVAGLFDMKKDRSAA